MQTRAALIYKYIAMACGHLIKEPCPPISMAERICTQSMQPSILDFGNNQLIKSKKTRANNIEQMGAPREPPPPSYFLPL